MSPIYPNISSDIPILRQLVVMQPLAALAGTVIGLTSTASTSEFTSVYGVCPSSKITYSIKTSMPLHLEAIASPDQLLNDLVQLGFEGA